MIPPIIDFFIPLHGQGARLRACLRMREFFRVHRWTFGSICLKNYMLNKWGMELGITAQISPKVLFMHTTGVVIGDGAVLKSGVKIYSNVVIGRKDVDNIEDYPIVEENCVLGTGCRVLGGVTIGPGTIIGANAVVLSDCEAGETYVGIPAKKVN